MFYLRLLTGFIYSHLLANSDRGIKIQTLSSCLSTEKR